MRVNKVRATGWMGAITVAAAALMLGGAWLAQGAKPTERVAQVRVCRVTLGQVEQVTALRGVLRGAEERAALCPAAGVVAAVYVHPGDRVQAGQALFRMEDSVQTATLSAALQQELVNTASAWAESESLSPLYQAAEMERQQSLTAAAAAMEQLTIRAAEDGVVQQVYAETGGLLTQGAPGVALSGEAQEIRCQAVVKDAQMLSPGMQARILDGETIVGEAVVSSIGAVEAVNGQSVCAVTLTPCEMVDLPLGAAVQVEIIRQAARDVPVLPVEAISDGDTVRWIAEGRCYEMGVQSLMADERCCWVDLPVGTQVVLSGDATQPGQKVRVTAE